MALPPTACIALYQPQPVNRQIELVVACILQQQKVAFNRTGLQVLQAAVDADAVIDMDHGITRFELCQ